MPQSARTAKRGRRGAAPAAPRGGAWWAGFGGAAIASLGTVLIAAEARGAEPLEPVPPVEPTPAGTAAPGASAASSGGRTEGGTEPPPSAGAPEDPYERVPAPEPHWGPSGDLYGVAAVGFLYSRVFGRADGHAWGGEVSWTWFPELGPPTEGWGAWFQLQSHPVETDTSGGEHVLRTAGGLQYSWTVLGGEVGWSYRAESSRFRGTHGVHLAPYLSIGLVALVPRITIALGGDGGWGHELALSVAVKAPIEAPAYPDYIRMGHGRPLRATHGGAAILPATNLAAPRGHGGGCQRRKTSPASLPSSGVAARGSAAGVRRWLRVAAEESAAVSAFARLTEELAQLGAPPTLVARAVGAAVDEQRHAAAALALARRVAATGAARAALAPRASGRAPAPAPGRVGGVVLGPLPVFLPRTPDLAALAQESLLDGCLGEGLAAEVARRRARRARTAQERAFYRTIAAEEHAHAELGWDILRWAVRGAGALGPALEAEQLRALVANVRPPTRHRAAALLVARRARARLRRWSKAARGTGPS